MTMDANAVVLERATTPKNQKEHMLRVDPAAEQQIIANTRAIPGIMTNRGCCYAGCKGVVLGPIKDMVLITHGPVGCGLLQLGAPVATKPRPKGTTPNFIQYCFTTDLQEPDIVFGGTKKLKKAIDEVMGALRTPKTIMIAATCLWASSATIQAVAAEAEKRNTASAAWAHSCCEGYKGVSQSAGHHIANNGLMKKVIGTGSYEPATTPSTFLAKYHNIGGDGWEQERVLRKIGWAKWSPSSPAMVRWSASPVPTRPTSTWSSATAPSTTSPK